MLQGLRTQVASEADLVAPILHCDLCGPQFPNLQYGDNSSPKPRSQECELTEGL